MHGIVSFNSTSFSWKNLCRWFLMDYIFACFLRVQCLIFTIIHLLRWGAFSLMLLPKVNNIYSKLWFLPPKDCYGSTDRLSGIVKSRSKASWSLVHINLLYLFSSLLIQNSLQASVLASLSLLHMHWWAKRIVTFSAN